jgi:thiol-disulfide isomerase/thioredoxin
VLFTKLSRNAMLPLASGTLILALSFCPAMQGAPQQAAQVAPKTQTQASSTSAQSNAQSLNSVMPDQPPTLADLARLAREKKKSEPAKSAKVIDDENLSHTPRDAAEMAMDASFNSAPSEQSSSSSSSSNPKGKITVLDFWATWCGPCREALPHLRDVAKKFQGQPLVVLSVSLDANEQQWKEFVAKNGMTWPQYRDGGFTSPISKLFNVTAIPHTFTIDAEGVLQDEHIGDASIEGKLKKLLAQARELQAKPQPQPDETAAK